MKTKSMFQPTALMRRRRDFMEIEKITQVLQKRGIQLTAFQYGERCHGGVRGIAWNADVIEILEGKYKNNNGKIEVMSGVTTAFKYFFKSVGAKWKKDYLLYGIDDVITVFSVIDCWALTILKHMFKNGYVSKCPLCGTYIHESDMFDSNCYDCHKKEKK